MKTIVLAGGCFWGLQKFFDQFEGVHHTETGYVNGVGEHPTYAQVCKGSHHAEALKIDYDDSVQLPQILAAYFAAIDPTSLNRQGNDIGENYRTGIYSNDEKERMMAQNMISDLQKQIDQPVVVEVKPLENYGAAEEEHQKYLDKHPAGYCHLPQTLLSGHRLPTMKELQEIYPSVFK